MVARSAVRTLNGHHVGFADDMPFFGEHVRKGIPVLRLEDVRVQMCDGRIEPLEGRGSMPANNPGHDSL